MSRSTLFAVGLLVAFGSACGGSPPPHEVAIKPPPEPMTRATLSGPLCQTDTCRCRDAKAPADGGAGVPEPGRKRFEVHVGPGANPLWVTIDDMVLYKSQEHAEECFYVDLAPGTHKLVFRASHAGGVSAALDVSEYGAATKSWYETFRFNCGSPGVCANEDMDAEKARYATMPRGVHDACGSVKVQDLAWDTGTSPDQAHPEDVQLELTLNVYKFAPKHPHGSDQCKQSD